MTMACAGACQVNKNLLPVKASYFFYFAGNASLLSYLSVYMKQLGLSPSETAIIYGILPFFGALVVSSIGSIADKLQCHKLTLMICCVISSVFIGALYFVPPVARNPQEFGHETKMEVVCSEEGSWMTYCHLLYSDEVDCSIWGNASNNFSSSPVSRLQCTLQCDFGHKTINSDPVCAATSHSAKNLSCSSIGIAKEVDRLYVTREISPASDSQFANSTSYVCHRYNISNFMIAGSSHQYSNCSHDILLPCSLQCDKQEHTDLYPECDMVESKPRKFTRTFWIFGALIFIGSLGNVPIPSLLNAMTYAYLGAERGNWGKQRLWGSAGFMLLGVISGIAMDVYSGSGHYINYMPSFIIYVVFCLLTGCTVCTYTISSDIACPQMKKNIGTLLRKLDAVCMLLVTLVLGIFHGVIYSFLFWHLQTLGGSQLLLGLTIVVTCIFEVPAMFYAGRVMKVIGEINCIHLVCVVYSLRFLGYSLLRDPWWVLAIEPLHGITYGLMQPAVSGYCSKITPPGMHGTIQGFINGLYFGFGRGCGSLLGGILFEMYGAYVTFKSQSVAAIVLLVFHGASRVYHHWCLAPNFSNDDEKDPDLERGPTEDKEFLPSRAKRSDNDTQVPGHDTHERYKNHCIPVTHTEPADCTTALSQPVSSSESKL